MSILVSKISKRNKKIFLYLLSGILPFIYNGCGDIRSNQSYFESTGVNTTPTSEASAILKPSSFIDTSANNSLVEDDSLFDIVPLNDGSRALFTDKTYTNIHSHLMTNSKFENMVYSGKVMFTSAGAGLGITFMSQYPNEDKYYRVRRYGSKPKFHLANHPDSDSSLGCKGENHDLITEPNEWYRFEIRTSVANDSTSFQIFIWPEQGNKLDYDPILCKDDSQNRIQSGVIGVWSMGKGEKYWADLRININPLDDGSNPTVREPASPTTPPTPSTPTYASCGSTIHGGSESRTRYQNQVVPTGSSCRSQVQKRTCDDGKFSSWSPNNYTFNSCRVESAPSGGGVVNTAHLGWTPGEDVTSKLANALKNLGTNKELKLSAMYKIRAAGVSVPSGVTLSAVKGGGLQATGIANASTHFLKLYSNTTLKNFTFIDNEGKGSRDYVTKNNKILIRMNGVTNVKIINSLFDANTKTLFHINGPNKNILIDGSIFRGAFYQFYIFANTDGFIVRNSLFEKGYGDGIKTGRNGSPNVVVKNILVENSIFQDLGRDGIDTTGGWQDSLVRGTIFRRLGVSAMDIKSSWNTVSEYSSRGNFNIRVENSEVIDAPNGFVLTTNDRPQKLSEAKALAYMPQDIFLTNIVFENHGTSTASLVFSKDAHHVYWNKVTMLGNTRELKAQGLKKPSDPFYNIRPNVSRTNFELVGTNVTTSGSTRPRNSNYPWSVVGPR